MSDELEKKDELPVVARMVIEIRSDGTRTVARGGFEDAAKGERVQVEAEGATPGLLMLSLFKSLRTLPAVARTLLLGSKDRGRR